MSLSFGLELSPPLQAQPCPQLSSVFSSTQLGTTGGTSAYSGSCGGSGAPEASAFYYAPRSGTYIIDTSGSAFDTLLYVRNNGGTELTCNDDNPLDGTQQSRVTVDLAAGQLAVIIVDGYATASGNFVLRINGNCPQLAHNDPRDLGSALSVSVNGRTATHTASPTSTLTPRCSRPTAVRPALRRRVSAGR